jgi:ornithine decarboxylase
VFSAGRVQNRWNLWTRELAGVRPYYAVKCNPDRDLLRVLAKHGAGFDCASEREINEVASVLGQTKSLTKLSDHVIYANPCKSLRDVNAAHNFGSPNTVVDSFEEIEKLAQIGWKGGALVRLLVDDGGSAMPFSSKFGINQKSGDAMARYAKVRGIPLKGVSFHVGSGCKDPSQYKRAVKSSLSVLKDLKANGHEADILDIGGGFMPNTNEFERSALEIRSALGPVLCDKSLKVIAEPGRYFATDAFDLFVQVIGKKPALSGKTDEWRYTIDESLYGQFSCIPFDQQKPIWIRVPKEFSEVDKKPRRRVKGTLFGRTCDSLDMIAKSGNMEDLEVGDWLWFPHMGAYTSVTASEFNGFPKPPQHGSHTHHVFLPDLKSILDTSWKERVPQQLDYVTPVRLKEENTKIPSIA